MANEALFEQWRAWVADRDRSGLSVRAWCAEHDVPEHRFYYWQRKFIEPAEDANVDWLPVDASASPRGREVRTLTIRVGSAAIDVCRGFDAELLSAVVAALADR